MGDFSVSQSNEISDISLASLLANFPELETLANHVTRSQISLFLFLNDEGLGASIRSNAKTLQRMRKY